MNYICVGVKHYFINYLRSLSYLRSEWDTPYIFVILELYSVHSWMGLDTQNFWLTVVNKIENDGSRKICYNKDLILLKDR